MTFKPPFYGPRERVKAGAEYRLYFTDGAGHIVRSYEFRSESDQSAVKTAEAWREARSMELWQRDRLVKRWD